MEVNINIKVVPCQNYYIIYISTYGCKGKIHNIKNLDEIDKIISKYIKRIFDFIV